MDFNTSDDLLKKLQGSILHCLSGYAAYINQWQQGHLLEEYGWHNRIWTIYDMELPVLMTELIALLGLPGKLLFAVTENGRIRLADALFSINLHGTVWQGALKNSSQNKSINACIAKFAAACTELSDALDRLAIS
jgi:hypothetical protein